MRWTKPLTLGLTLLAATALGGFPQVQAGELKVMFTGLVSNAGKVRVALVNTKAGYDDEAKFGFKLAEVGVKELKAEHTFSDVPPGIYAIKAFHDQNADKKHNRGLFGQPLEPYGFSNNARGMFGPPPFEKTTFRLEAAPAEIVIKLAK
jgi:uncharacterized protein (DUF2141 family)